VLVSNIQNLSISYPFGRNSQLIVPTILERLYQQNQVTQKQTKLAF